jgi:hypothetical protein
MEFLPKTTNMTNKELSIGSILNQQDFGQVVVAKIFQDHIYAHLPNGNPLGMLMLDEVEPIEISEKYLLDFGFTKIEEIHEEYHSIDYELETKEVFFSYLDDWSLAIADSKNSFKETSNYICIEKELTNKIHLWQNLFKSMTGKDTYEKEYK